MKSYDSLLSIVIDSSISEPNSIKRKILNLFRKTLNAVNNQGNQKIVDSPITVIFLYAVDSAFYKMTKTFRCWF